ncbi:hypothetical protein [Fuchsiella alkaliacetigena]|uniref:hypothetical protein n=1 Tax=Fuchsiella alkaliacetigena TaxID=957042 RepID=UPI00200B36B2|nr:hypothetical protein [Fuchsiella alkaliacetigena]MCK8825658.1 hypothetical protein [Fuchsiella alkaliacetigena]
MLEQQLKDECCWCGSNMSSGDLWSVEARFNENSKLTVKEEGYIKEGFSIGNKENIWILIIGKKSPAKKQGVDILFITCSKRCAQELRENLKEDLRFHSLFT